MLLWLLLSSPALLFVFEAISQVDGYRRREKSYEMVRR
jgi:hypothetical protein